MKNFKLQNGLLIPNLAYGTWLIPNDKACDLVLMALDAGYRHIDTAQAYGNEEGVGNALKLTKIKREDIYVTSKVKAEIKNYQDAYQSILDSLKRLNLAYIDLMLIHCPQPWNEFRGPNCYYKENVEVWKALEKAYREGLVKAIGVSNFNQDDLNNLFAHCEIKPMVNQICIHIGQTDQALIDFCHENDIIVEAYSPIAHGRALNHPLLVKYAEKYHVSVPQLCIKYTLQLGTISIPKASSLEHIVANLQLDFAIEEEDMHVLQNLKSLNA